MYRPDADARFPVINLAELGRLDESQETVARLLELEPNLTLSALRGRAPIADPKLMDLFLNGLRKAGPLDCGTVGLQKRGATRSWPSKNRSSAVRLSLCGHPPVRGVEDYIRFSAALLRQRGKPLGTGEEA